MCHSVEVDLSNAWRTIMRRKKIICRETALMGHAFVLAENLELSGRLKGKEEREREEREDAVRILLCIV
jgi:hypothetical protein